MDLNLKLKMIQHLEKKEGTFQDIGLGQECLDLTHKA